jgi:30S ribosomal protein S31
MGKGDKRTRRGKIFAGSHGKTRPKYKKEVFVASADGSAATPSAPKERKPKVRKKKTEDEAAA